VIRVMSVVVLGVSALGAAGCRGSTAPFTCRDVGGTFDPRAPKFIVSYQKGVDPTATTARLETKYGFTASNLYTAPPGFAAELSDRALTGVSCDPTVSSIWHDGLLTLGTQ